MILLRSIRNKIPLEPLHNLRHILSKNQIQAKPIHHIHDSIFHTNESLTSHRSFHFILPFIFSIIPSILESDTYVLNPAMKIHRDETLNRKAEEVRSLLKKKGRLVDLGLLPALLPRYKKFRCSGCGGANWNINIKYPVGEISTSGGGLVQAA